MATEIEHREAPLQIKFLGMGKQIDTMLFCFFFLLGFLTTKAQCKIVYIESEKIHVRYFLKKEKSMYTENDSVYYIASRINDSVFTLNKYVYKKNIYACKYKIEPAKDDLVIYEKRWSKKERRNIIVRSKIKYFIGVKLDN